MEQLNTLGIDFFSIVVYAVNFGVIFFVISKFVTKPLVNMLDKRRNDIKSNITESEKLRKQIEIEKNKLLIEKEKLNKELEEELALLRKNASRELAEQKLEMQAKQEKLLKEARDQIKVEKDNLISEAKQDIVNILSTAFNKVLSKNLSEKDIENSVEEAVLSLKNDTRNI